jgi:hypothetical protein
MLSIDHWKESKLASLLHIIIGITAIFIGMNLFGNIILLDLLVAFYLLIFGFLILFVGLIGLFVRDHIINRGAAGLWVVLGIITILLGHFALLSPLFVAIILGIGLIVDGVSAILGWYDSWFGYTLKEN